MRTETLLRLAEGCGAILHFGGISMDQPYETVSGPNLDGLYHIYEAARREGWPVTFSAGLITWVEPPDSVDAMLRAADELMYTAKRHGKKHKGKGHHELH